MTTTSIPTRRDNLHTVYMYIVRSWAVDVNDMAKGLVHLDNAETAAQVKTLTKEQIRSLLGTLERKGLVVGEQVNGEGAKVWQSYFDIENESNVIENAEAKFAETFPNEVKDAKTPTQVDKRRPDEGEVIYEVKRTRSTGAHVTLTNYSKGTGERRYIATCITHSTVHEFAKRLPAESMCHHPEEWCADCQVIDTTNGHELTERALNPRYAVQFISVGAAGLTQRPSVYDTEDGFTVKVFQGKNGTTNAEKYAAKLNASTARP